MPTDIKVKDAMVNRVVTAKPEQSVEEGAKIMKEEDVGLLVIMEGKTPVGVVTREDVVTKITAKDRSASTIRLKEIMSSPVIAIEPSRDIADAARLMVKHGFERLPVMQAGKLVGILSDREIAKTAPAAIEILRERLLAEEEGEGVPEATEGECELCGNFNEELKMINGKWVCSSCEEEAAEL